MKQVSGSSDYCSFQQLYKYEVGESSVRLKNFASLRIIHEWGTDRLPFRFQTSAVSA